VLLGGGLTSALPEECEREADVVFHGEAELTWPAFLSDLARGAPKATYRAEERFDLAQSRMPRLDLLDIGAYSTGSVQTSRGCPYTCTYCDVPLIDGSKPRTKKIELVLQELEALYERGQRSFFIVDDHFLGTRGYALRLLGEIEKFVRAKNYKPVFYCQATLNVAKDEEALTALYRANFRRLFIGIESDDLEALAAVGKKQNTLLSVAESVSRIQKYNITVWAALLAGFDTDGKDVFDRYRRLIAEAGIGMIIPGLLQAVPGTAYYEHVTKQQRLVPLRNRYVAGQAGSLDGLLVTNVRPARMTTEELLAGYKRFVRDIYQYDAFGDRVIGFLEAGRMPELGAADFGDVWRARKILGRAFRHYVLAGDPARRRFFVRIMRYLLKTRFRRVDETIFHLVIYKHLREFYEIAADERVPMAADVAQDEAAWVAAAQPG
jgi:radical SAM superfamily enzyme YgiQ (UPF0313 family)